MPAINLTRHQGRRPLWPVRTATASSSLTWSTITECDVRCIAQPSARGSYDHRAAKRRCAFRGMLGLKVHSLQRSQPRRLSCPKKLAKAAVSARRVDRRPAGFCSGLPETFALSQDDCFLGPSSERGGRQTRHPIPPSTASAQAAALSSRDTSQSVDESFCRRE